MQPVGVPMARDLSITQVLADPDLHVWEHRADSRDAVPVLSGFARLDTVLALAPQFSIHPEVVPDENRWMEHREKLTELRIRTAGEHLNAVTDCVIAHGRPPREAVQRDKFPLAPNIRHFVLPRTHHDVPQKLKMAGVLAPFMKAVIDKRIKRARLILQDNFGAVLRQPDDLTQEVG